MTTPRGGPREVRYADVLAVVQPRVDAEFPTPAASFEPFYKDSILKRPGPIIVLTVGGGIGTSKDALFDRPFIGVRVIGYSQDYDATEALALFVDRTLLAVGAEIGFGDEVDALYIVRTGGRPTLLLEDSAERQHWTCSYITEATSGL